MNDKNYQLPLIDNSCLVTDPESKLQLADVINLLPTSEVIFLLTALANMAQCRKAEETEFIEAVAFGLFEVFHSYLL